MNKTTVAQQDKTAGLLLSHRGILQRKCACGNHTVTGEECPECAKKKSGLQRKLAIGASNDPMEQEAERIAAQVLASTGRNAVSGAPLRIQRYTEQAAEATQDAASDSVDRVLTGSGRPLEPVLRQDMEQRFGHDFSRVRVHSGPAAEQSARDVNARAYTVGHNIVFGTGQFVPTIPEGRRILAHELTHVVQQGGTEGIRARHNDETHDLSAMMTSSDRSGMSCTATALVQREPTKPRAATGKESISDLTAQTTSSTTGKASAGSLAKQEWESLFRRHFSEPDKIEDEVESSHARYLYSNIYGWIDAQHFFAHIQFAEEMGLQNATDKGIDIEGKQALVRKMIGPDPDDTSIYSDLLEHNLISPSDFLHYREGTFISIALGMDAFLSKQEKALLKGFDDEKLAKMILDNAMSAWSYEDLVSNQLGVQFFRLHGAYVNAGKDAMEVRQRFIDKMIEYFAAIQVVEDSATIKAKKAKLPGKERWTSPKMSKAEASKKHPELFEFNNVTHRVRAVIHTNQVDAEKGKEYIAKVAPSVRGLHVEPIGSQFAVYSAPVSHFEAVLIRALLSKAIPINLKSVVIEPVVATAPSKP